MDGVVVFIDGVPGAGKTLLVSSLEKIMNGAGIPCKTYTEYRNEVLLKQYTSDMGRYGYTFQVSMLMRKASIQKDAIRFCGNDGIAIIDRSIYGDMAFAKNLYEMGYIKDNEWGAYKEMVSNVEKPDNACYIYLKVSTSTALNRIKERGVVCEGTYTKEYIQSLTDQTENLIPASSIEVEWDQDKKVDRYGVIPGYDLESILSKIQHHQAFNNLIASSDIDLIPTS